MNKTINISLNGVHFNIDENAYTTLSEYLTQLKSSFHNDEGKDEIMQDIETRIAELFKSYLGIGRDVVSEKDVDKMISVMGAPEQYLEEEITPEQAPKKSYSQKSQDNIQKKLFRDLDEKIIGGVLAGVSHYFGWNPIILRAIYLGVPLMTMIFDWGISSMFFFVSYTIMWIIIPPARTNIQKLEMYGEPVNIDSIKKNISKEEIQETVDNITGFTKEVVQDATPYVEKIAKGIFKFLKAAFSINILFIGIGTIIGAFSMLITSLVSNQYYFSIGDFIFDEAWQFYTFIVFLFLLILSIGLLFTYLGVNLLKSQNRFKNGAAVLISCFAIFFISLFGVIYIGAGVAIDFNDKFSYNEKEKLPFQQDTIVVAFNDDKTNTFYSSKHNFEEVLGMNKNMDSLRVRVWNDLKIKKSDDQNFYLERIYSSKGGNKEEARSNIENITYRYTTDGNKLILPEYLSIPSHSKYRFQEVELVLYVPEGKHVLTQNIDDLYNENMQGIEEIRNQSDSEISVIVNGDTLYCNNCPGQIKKGKTSAINIKDEDGSYIINEDSITIEDEKGSVKIKFKE